MVFIRTKRFLGLLLIPALVIWHASLCGAVPISKEEEMGREFMKVVFDHYQLIDDPVISGYVEKVGRHIASVFPNHPFEYHFYVLKEPVYNAFAAPAGHVFINSGLFAAMESEAELAGILAHEIAHVECRHISQKIERSTKINMITLAGVAAGIFLGMGGADTAANALSIGSMAAGQSMELAYSREDELQADQLGLNYLYKAGYSAAGLLEVLKKIRKTEWFGSDIIPTYLRTHPASEDRIAYIGSWLATRKAPTPKSPTRAEDFRRAHTRLLALYGNVNAAQNRFENALEKDPKDIMANYGLGIVYDRKGDRETAQKYLKTALSEDPLDPYILNDLGRIYFYNGQYQEAIAVLKDSVYVIEDNTHGLFFLGRTELELGEYEKAVRSFVSLIRKKPDYDMAHFFLGEAYGKLGRLYDAHYHLGLEYKRQKDFRTAKFHFERALERTRDPDERENIRAILDEMHEIMKENGPPRAP